jgi:FixJ family two-component response regulator
LLEAGTLGETIQLLNGHPSAVLVCEAVLPDGAWTDLLRHAARLPVPAPVIVAAFQADNQLWMEVLNRGGYNLLPRPFTEREVFRVLSMAWLHGRGREPSGAQANVI